jgi:hypothetical protein
MLPQVKPAGTVSVRLTVPLNVPTPVIVIVEVADVPTVTDAGEVAVIVNSFWVTVKVAVVEWESAPLVPVIVTLYVAKVFELHERVAVPELVTLPGVIAPQVRPTGTVSVSVTVPVNPLTAVMVIVDVSEDPTVPVAEVAVMVKSVTMKVTVVEWVSVPLVPVIVSV